MKKRLFAALAAIALVSGCASNTVPVEGEDPSVAAVPYEETEQNEAFVQDAKDRIFFGFDQSSLNVAAIKVLKTQAEWLKANPDATILVEGHADDRGTREYNLALGERRAVAVKNYLISRGVEADRIRVISYGKERPAVVGANEAAWSQNRRAVTIVKI